MKVTMLQPTRHDGKRYAPGDVVDLPKPAAQSLIACGAAEEGGALKKSPTSGAAAKADTTAAAEKAVADAQALLSAAADQPAKDPAQQQIDSATITLTALQA